MSALQPVRGTHDLLPDEMRRHRRVTEQATATAGKVRKLMEIFATKYWLSSGGYAANDSEA